MEKTEQTEDLRVRRTRKTLQEALIALTIEKGFAAVTVRDITERAMVNRSTFYRHYLDKYELLDQYMADVNAMMSEYDSSSEDNGLVMHGPSAGLIALLKHVQQFGAFYRVMLGQKGDPAFTEQFRQNTARRFRTALENTLAKTTPNAPPTDLKLNYISCASIGALMWWVENGDTCSAEQLATWLGQFVMATMSVGLSGPGLPDAPPTK